MLYISFHSENKENIGKMDFVLSCINFPVGVLVEIIRVTCDSKRLIYSQVKCVLMEKL